MKKLFSTVLVIFQLVLLCSCQNQTKPAELKIKNSDGVEETYHIHTTDDPDKVKQVLHVINDQGVFEGYHMNGAAIQLTSRIEGTVDIHNDNKTTSIDLGYDIKASLETNLKAYQAFGDLRVKGYTKSQSEDMYLNSEYEIQGNVKNDDDYLYIDGAFLIGSTKGNAKRKINIQGFTEKYKAMIVSFLDLVKYYKLSSLIDDLDSFVDGYQVVISKTTTDSFVLTANVPASLLDESLSSCLVLDVCFDVKNLLPIEISFHADEVIKECLQQNYVEEYLTEDIDIKSALFELSLSLNYGNYTIQSIEEENKSEYLEFKIDGLF